MDGIYAIKPKFQQALKPIEALLIACRIHPDAITISALILSFFGAAAFAFSSQAGMLWLLWSSPFVALGRTMLNALDGMVAKDTGVARAWGEVLNELCDRMADIALFVGLACSRLCNGQLLIASLISILLSSYLGILSKAAGGPRQYGGIMGKADRMILLALLGPLTYILVTTGICSAQIVVDSFALILLVGSLITIVQRAKKTYVDLQSTNN